MYYIRWLCRDNYAFQEENHFMDVKNKSMAIGLWIVFLTIIVCFVCRNFSGIGLFFASAVLVR